MIGHIPLLFLLLHGLALAAAADDPRALVRCVRVEGVRPAPVPERRLQRPPKPVSAQIAAGRLLLHRRGCTGCHDLDLPTYPHPRGPDLGGIGRKTRTAWLDLWLRDPAAYLPHSRMPRVRLGDAARTRIVAWLAGLGRPDSLSSPPPAGDAYRGARLFESLQCQGCHAAGGSGGRMGPALDRLGWKVGGAWLLAALREPASEGLSPESHPYVLSARDATDLSAFLVRRFSPPGGPDQNVMADTLDAAAGLGEALVQGCFQCHRVGALRGPRLRLPIGAERARFWLRAHEIARGELPAMPLSAPQMRAMAAALGGEAPADSVGTSPPFWKLPVAGQGDPPELFDAGRRLEPAACGQCHEKQLTEWRSSRHAATFSPGLRAQLVGASTGFVEECLSCHTPLREQIDRALSLLGDLSWPTGVDCAGCHVRAHRYYGPGRPGNRHRLVASTIEAAHHGGVEAAPDLFGGESFCAPCHQFEADGLALEGKLLQNTYGEWLAGPDAEQGRTCQGCHMPGGDHRMRGLHDRDFVRDALEFEADWHVGSHGGGRLRVTLRNVGAGHSLPTYATGALHIKVFLSDDEDGVIESSLQTRAAQRRLTVDGQTELFDTRIPAGGVWSFEESFDIVADARFVNVLVEVDPDHFYRRFFSLLEPSDAGARVLLAQARGEISDSPYILFARQIRVTHQK